MIPYPPLEADALTTVITVARQVASGQAGSVDKAHAAHACWSLAGTGLNAGLPDATALKAATQPDFNVLADNLQAMKDGKKAALPWGQLVIGLIQLLLTIFGGGLTPTPAA